jgi:4-hydroxy-3-polyprenylbenzoate decarboxylase
MSYYPDLRAYLAALEEHGKLRRVSRVINKDTELHPLVRWQFRGLDEAQRTGWLFENLTDLAGKRYEGRVATAILGASREVYSLGLQCAPGEVWERWQRAYAHPVPPVRVDGGPCKEVVQRGQDLAESGGLCQFPIPMSTNGWEALPRLTAVSWFTRDPETGTTNIGTYNGTLLGPLRTSCRLQAGAHLRRHLELARASGRKLEAAMVLGAVPVVGMVAGTRVPYGLSELDVAGGLAGEPIPVVRCETVDLDVPATAEIVIEGEIDPNRVEPDPPSGEHTGYMIVGAEVNPFTVRCITHRRQPIWHDFISQMPPSESSTIRGIGLEGTMLSFLRKDCGIPQVKSVALHHEGGSWRLMAIQFQDLGGQRTPPSVVWQALFACLGKHPDYPKILFAVDEDIDPHDFASLMWALAFRFQPHRDLKVIQGRTAQLDQSAMPNDPERGYSPAWIPHFAGPEGASAMLVDATRKWGYTPVSLPKRPYMERAREIWDELGLPPLQPRAPWYGYDLGNWPESFRRLAELGEEGRFDTVAQELLSRGHPIQPG